MKDIEYSYEDSRCIEVSCDNKVISDSYSARIRVYKLSHEENKKLRSMIEEFCRGAE